MMITEQCIKIYGHIILEAFFILPKAKHLRFGLNDNDLYYKITNVRSSPQVGFLSKLVAIFFTLATFFS